MRGREERHPKFLKSFGSNNMETPNGQKLQEHINKETEDHISRLYGHAEIANKEMGLIKESLGVLSTDMNWLKKFFWLVAGSSIGGLITGIINLLIK